MCNSKHSTIANKRKQNYKVIPENSWSIYESNSLRTPCCRSPDAAKVRSKMLYASSKDRFKRELDGIQVELQATDPSEMSFDIIKARAF